MNEHPLTETFDLPAVQEPLADTDLVIVKEDEVDGYDEKDQKINVDFDTIYREALVSFKNLSDEMLLVDGAFKASVGETSNKFLNTALAAAKEKASHKQHKDKIKLKSEGAGNSVTNNNLLVGNHEELLRMLSDVHKMNEEKVIEEK